MALASNYVVISPEPSPTQHKNFTLSFASGGDIDTEFLFTLPANAAVGERAVLAFRTGPDTTQTNLKFQVEVNPGTPSGAIVFVASLWNSTDSRTMNEVIERGPLKVGVNKMIFKLVSGQGSFTFSDVVLWYKINN